ncbi:hypothetical protein DB35_12045 [Streptomyces abyssalis]|uniref:DUF742 domain-containing protein n=1 Tax=Streptomyces abyssalis TaxID=933944 RepID=A0A1E7JH79_9ACTN|nr:DUF742 domain-containing protein [Streptomyces abyssalis]OEU85835.1 hypothetical protein AN215_25895 [Streptomyces abyssalis]OEU92701.1 hypothetical protein DB35_12045 [Streptomyces abyssalis]OEV31761.1 hypothetical protein AN219_03155 [Streptomyces nanshensis]
MTMPPGGPSSYGSGHENGRPRRFNFPSTPSRHAAGQQPGYEQQGPGQPHQQPPPPPPSRRQPSRYDEGLYESSRYDRRQERRQYDQGPPPRIQTVQPQPRKDPANQGGRTEQQPLVRPYAMTGGRTRPRYQLAIEALVHTSAEPARLQGQLPEHQRICRLCYEIKSVAEISALLTIPLGVARILVADLAEAGLVAIHQPGGDDTNSDGQPDVTLLERVLSGLRKL